MVSKPMAPNWLIYPHGCYLRVNSWSVPGLAYSQVEERQETEYISQGRVEAVVVRRIVVADVIEFRH